MLWRFFTSRTWGCLTAGQLVLRLLIVKVDFKSIFLSKTSDELLALAVSRHSLEPEAQSALWDELRRRKLTDPHLRLRASPDETPPVGQNPAFNTPAKIAALAMCVGLVGLGLTYIIAVAQGHQLGIFVVACALVWGPIFLFSSPGRHVVHFAIVAHAISEIRSPRPRVSGQSLRRRDGRAQNRAMSVMGMFRQLRATGIAEEGERSLVTHRLEFCSLLDLPPKVRCCNESGVDNELFPNAPQFDGTTISLVESNFTDLFPFERRRMPKRSLGNAFRVGSNCSRSEPSSS